MRKIIIWLIAIILFSCCHSGGINIHYYPFKDNGKWGVFDSRGHVILYPKFDTISAFGADGIAYFYESNRCGYINNQGRVIVLNKYLYCYCFNEGVARVTGDNDNELIIDKNGVVLFSSTLDTFDTVMKNGLFLTYSGTLDMVYGNPTNNYMNKYGQCVIHTPYTNGTAFAEGVAKLWNGKESLYIDTLGKKILSIPIYWGYCDEPSEGLISVRTDSAVYYLDRQNMDLNKPVLVKPTSNKYLYAQFKNGFALVYDPISRKYAFMDKYGKLIIPPIYEYMSDFSEGLSAVRNSGGKFGFIDTSGKIVIPMRYDNVLSPFLNELAMVKYNDKIFWINKKGDMITPMQE